MDKPNSLQYELLLVEKVLKVSITDKSISENRMTPLPQSASELQSLSLSSFSENLTLLDCILIERLSFPETNVLLYTSDSYSYVKDELSKAWSVRSEEVKAVLTYLLQALVSYGALSTSHQDMFPDQSPPAQPDEISTGALRLLEFIDHSAKTEFVSKLVEYWDNESPDFKVFVFERAFEMLCDKARRSDIKNGGFSCMQVLRFLVDINGIPEIIMSLNWGAPNMKGLEIESSTFFGPFFSMSFCPREEFLRKIPGMAPPPHPVRDGIFEDIERCKSKSDLFRQYDRYANDTKTYVEGLSYIFKKLLRCDKDKLFNWIGYCIKSNLHKSKLGSQIEGGVNKMVSSNGFMFNLLDVLLELCGPIIGSTDNKSTKIDPSYFICDEKMASIDDSPLCIDAPKIPKEIKQYGTITEFFFLCLKLVNLAWYPFMQSYKTLGRIRNQVMNNPQLEDEKKYFGLLSCAHEIFLLDSNRNAKLKKLSLFTLDLLLKWMNFDGNVILPPVNEILGMLPEHIIEDMNEYYNIIIRAKTSVLSTVTKEELLVYYKFSILAVHNTDHIKNPYLRAKLGENTCLFITKRVGGDPVSIISTDPFVENYILMFVIHFYVDAEVTGTHNQFYEKFEYRHIASKVLKYLWTFDKFRVQVRNAVSDNYFNRFVNMLINDTVFCLDDGLKNISKIKVFQERLRTGEALNEEEEKERDQATKIATHFLMQANESIDLTMQVSEWHSVLFIEEEFRDRVASTLNYYLTLLCGPKGLTLKVQNPELYNFKPKELLGNIMMLYINLSNHREFCESVVKDERSYDSELLQRASRISNKNGIIQRNKQMLWDQLVTRIKEIAQESQNLADKLGEIPEEFVCPISYDMMKHPVKLPSGYTVDRATISRILLDDEHDPFTRQPLNMTMIEDDHELKAQIDSWIAEKLSS